MVRMSTQLESDIVAVERVEEYIAVSKPNTMQTTCPTSIPGFLKLYFFIFIFVCLFVCVCVCVCAYVW